MEMQIQACSNENHRVYVIQALGVQSYIYIYILQWTKLTKIQYSEKSAVEN
jgi:hypothetical protein